MSSFLYNILIRLYGFAVFIAANFNKKAGLWIKGRKDWRSTLSGKMLPYTSHKKVWLHCASLGEFEQARPVIEALKEEYPDCCIIVSFFSPSGYEIRKDYELADIVCYLPLDTPKNAKDYLNIIHPDIALFIKYEFWYHYIQQLAANNIPVLLVAGTFRKEQVFFRWYGGMFRRMLLNFDYLLLQDDASLYLLQGIIDTEKTIVTGDTRYDRVVQIAAQAKQYPLVEKFIRNNEVLIAGSTWPDDEAVLKDYLTYLPEGWKIIIAPHEIDEAHIKKIIQLFEGNAVRYSHLTESPLPTGKVLVIDNMGMLSSLYRYGSIALVGGGFNPSGIHNTLEAAVFGLPILFGPYYKKFVEANELVALGAAFPVDNETQFRRQMQLLLQDDQLRSSIHENTLSYIQQHKGASYRTLRIIKNKRYLNNG